MRSSSCLTSAWSSRRSVGCSVVWLSGMGQEFCPTPPKNQRTRRRHRATALRDDVQAAAVHAGVVGGARAGIEAVTGAGHQARRAGGGWARSAGAAAAARAGPATPRAEHHTSLAGVAPGLV